MDEHTFEKSDLVVPVVVAKRTSIPRLVWLLFVLAVVSVGALGLTRYRQQTMPAQRSIFSPETQFVPKGATSQSVASGLQALNFSKPLPFFDEKNVVQSLDLSPHTSSTSPVGLYLSYRVSGQTTDTLRATYTKYFQNMNWRMITVTPPANKSLIFASPLKTSEPSRIIEVFFGSAGQQDTNGVHHDVVVSLSLSPLTARNSSKSRSQ